MSFEDGKQILQKEGLRIEKLKQQMCSRQFAVQRLMKKLKVDQRTVRIKHDEHISNEIMYCQKFIQATQEQIARCEHVKGSLERVQLSLEEGGNPSMSIDTLKRLVKSSKEFNVSFRKVLGQIDAYYNKLIDYDSYVQYVHKSHVS